MFSHREDAPPSNSAGFTLGFIGQNWSSWPSLPSNKWLTGNKIARIGLWYGDGPLFPKIKGSLSKEKVGIWLLGNEYSIFLICIVAHKAIYKVCLLVSLFFFSKYFTSYICDVAFWVKREIFSFVLLFPSIDSSICSPTDLQDIWRNSYCIPGIYVYIFCLFVCFYQVYVNCYMGQRYKPDMDSALKEALL